MHSYEDIRKIDYYLAGNDFSGSEGDFNFKIIPIEKLKVYIWHGKYCFQKSKPEVSAEFELTEEGLENVKKFLTEKYNSGII